MKRAWITGLAILLASCGGGGSAAITTTTEATTTAATWTATTVAEPVRTIAEPLTSPTVLTTEADPVAEWVDDNRWTLDATLQAFDSTADDLHLGLMDDAVADARTANRYVAELGQSAAPAGAIQILSDLRAAARSLTIVVQAALDGNQGAAFFVKRGLDSYLSGAKDALAEHGYER